MEGGSFSLAVAPTGTTGTGGSDNKDWEMRFKTIEAEVNAQTSQVRSLRTVLVVTVVAGTILMMTSVLVPYFYSTLPETIITKMDVQTFAQLTSAPRDVLPFATALVGFAAGVVTALYGRATKLS
jgi:hypothetical protein